MKGILLRIVSITFLVISLALSPTLLGLNASGEELLSPRQQMASGIDANDVICKKEFVLMIRSTNGAAACVTSPTSLKLADAGWGTIIKTDFGEEPSDKEVELKESLSMDTDESTEEEGTTQKVTIEEEVGTESKGP